MRSRRRAGGLVIASFGIIGMLFGAGHCGGLRINLTPSYPLGLWRIEPLGRTVAVGDLVFICPPDTAPFVSALERGYIRPGICPRGIGPLIKTILAVGGQQVDIAGSVTIDGWPLAHSRVRGVDPEGRALPDFAGGIVPAGWLYLHSDFAGSFDSRYFGFVPATGLLGLARPVFTYGP